LNAFKIDIIGQKAFNHRVIEGYFIMGRWNELVTDMILIMAEVVTA
jgi:hypothetical protein